jgi:hypothetical protein
VFSTTTLLIAFQHVRRWKHYKVEHRYPGFQSYLFGIAVVLRGRTPRENFAIGRGNELFRFQKGGHPTAIEEEVAIAQRIWSDTKSAGNGGNMSAGDAITVLLLGGLLGLFGQGARAVVGLKTLADYANAPNPTQNDVFNAARLTVSLIIGFLAGVAAALTCVLAKVQFTDIGDHLLQFAAAGYVGTDVIEAFTASFFDKTTPTGLKAPSTPAGAVSLDAVSSLLDDKIAPVQDKLDLLTAHVAEALPCGGVYVGSIPPTVDQIRTYVLAAAGPQYNPTNTKDNTQISPTIRGGDDPIWTFARDCMNYSEFEKDNLTINRLYVETRCSKIGDFIACIQNCYQNRNIPRPAGG